MCSTRYWPTTYTEEEQHCGCGFNDSDVILISFNHFIYKSIIQSHNGYIINLAVKSPSPLQFTLQHFHFICISAVILLALYVLVDDLLYNGGGEHSHLNLETHERFNLYYLYVQFLLFNYIGTGILCHRPLVTV